MYLRVSPKQMHKERRIERQGYRETGTKSISMYLINLDDYNYHEQDKGLDKNKNFYNQMFFKQYRKSRFGTLL